MNKNFQTEKEYRRYRAGLIRKIFGLAQYVHPEAWDSQELKEAIHNDIIRWQIANQPSISKLKISQMKELIMEYEMRLGMKPYERKKETSYHPHPEREITQAQQMLIVNMFDELGYDVRARAEFCKHIIKKFWPQTRGEAYKIIEGLKAVKQKRKEKNENRRNS